MLKRAFDIAFALAALAGASPIAAAVAVAIRLEDGGPIIYRHARVGRHGIAFDVLKFRSMNVQSGGAQITTSGEDRITRVGRVIRKFKLDEIPQFVNVLRGDMSIVGPRPEVPEFVDLYPAEYELLLQHRPGITDPASIKFRDEEEQLAAQAHPQEFYKEVLLPSKLALSMDYVQSQSLALDMKIVVETAAAVLRKDS